MPDGLHRGEAPAEVLEDVVGATGFAVTVLDRLSGGINGGATHVRLEGSGDAVLKIEPRTRPDQLNDLRRAERVVAHMRRRGYPTPAWLAAGGTAAHVWHLTEFVDAAPVRELTPSLVEQLMAVIELQAGQASTPHDHSAYAWRVVTGQEPILAVLAGYSAEVTALVGRALRVSATAPPPKVAPDMVHADLNPGNVLVRDGVVMALVDIGNAGSGTRATDLTTVLWHTVQRPLDDVRARLWERILDLAGWEGAAVLAASQVLLQLEWPVRLGLHEVVADAARRGGRVLDELEAHR